MEIGQVTIRRMAASDAAQVAALCEQLGYPASPEQVQERLREMAGQSQQDFCVAEHSTGRIVGWMHLLVCQAMTYDKRAEIWGLVVDQEHRGRGIGRLLMTHAERWASERGCSAICLRSNVIREHAHGFYGKLGYRRIKTQHVFVKDLGHPDPRDKPAGSEPAQAGSATGLGWPREI